MMPFDAYRPTLSYEIFSYVYQNIVINYVGTDCNL